MELHFTILSRVICCSIFISGTVLSSFGASGAQTSINEQSKRQQNVEEAEELLNQGDKSYEQAKYANAVTAYSDALDLIPNSPLTKVIYEDALERFSQASVAEAKAQLRRGDAIQARALLDKVLSKNPKHQGAQTALGQLDDPIRSNPSATIEHAKNVDEVRRMLYAAEGAYNLGKFDEAYTTYQKVLVIDAHNTAARRGMELVNQAKANHHQSARDEARSKNLAEVDQAWSQSSEPETTDIPVLQSTMESNGAEQNTPDYKLSNIILTKFDVDDAPVIDALRLLQQRVNEADISTPDPLQKGISLNANIPVGDPAADAKVNLHLKNIPAKEVLRQICEQTNTSYSIDDFAVTVRVGKSTVDQLVTRYYEVTPDFFSSATAQAPNENTDPFADKTQESGLLVKRMGAKEILEANGIQLTAGSSVSYLSSSHKLQVTTTPQLHDSVDAVLAAFRSTLPTLVTINVTMMKTTQENLEELGYDWLLGNFAMGSQVSQSGSRAINISGGTRGNGGDVLGQMPVDNSLPYPNNPMTSGNRSGDEAISRNSIDAAIAAQNTGAANAGNRAPGVMSFNGVIDGASIQAMMRGLDQKKAEDTLVRASVKTRSGQQSSIQIVREFFYPEEYEPPELPQNLSGGQTPVTSATPTSFKSKNIGTILNVLPTLNPQTGIVELSINPIISKFDGFVNYGSPINTTMFSLLGGNQSVEAARNEILQPIFSENRINTNVLCRNGSTVVLGGLMEEKVERVDDKLPILGDIPIAGRLFKTRASKPSKTAILFFVNVELSDLRGKPIQ